MALLFRVWAWLLRLYVCVRFGKITERITGTAGDNVPAEIEYLDRRGEVVGFWAYGYWHPKYPYRGQDEQAYTVKLFQK